MLIATLTGREICDVHQHGEHVFINFGRLGMMLTPSEAFILSIHIDEAAKKAAHAADLSDQLRALA